jgi:hypothetical protein
MRPSSIASGQALQIVEQPGRVAIQAEGRRRGGEGAIGRVDLGLEDARDFAQ